VARKPTPKQSSVAQARSSRRPSSGRTWEGFKSLAALIAIFLAIRIFIIQAYRIPSASMVPSLLVGDWLFVNQFIYGPTLPFTNHPIRLRIPGTAVRLYKDPKREEIVVFQSPPQSDQPEDPTPTLVKRVIGMPGDTIYMRKGLVYINGVPHPHTHAAQDASEDGTESSYSGPIFDWQHKAEIKGSRFGPPPVRPTLDDWGPLLVPAEHYMMLGDNRHNSKDSRYWGFVPRTLTIGTAARASALSPTFAGVASAT